MTHGCTTAAAALSLALGVAAGVQAQDKVYRCGPGGSQYSTTPCPGGTTVDVADPRTAEQKNAARAVTEDQKKLAEQLARERQQRERAAANQKPGNLAPAKPKDKPTAKKIKPKGKQGPAKPKDKPGEEPALSPAYRPGGTATSQ